MTSREPHAHTHGHTHGHTHSQDHDHAQAHAPGLSLIRVSAAQRVAGAAALAGLLWLGVFWALT